MVHCDHFLLGFQMSEFRVSFIFPAQHAEIFSPLIQLLIFEENGFANKSS